MYTIYFPSTLYEDFINVHPNLNVLDYLYSNDLDENVINDNLSQLSPIEKECFYGCLSHDNYPLTFRSLAEELSNNTKKNISRYLTQSILLRLEEMNLLYFIDRFDVKTDSVIGGRLVYPIDNRFYLSKNPQDRDLRKFMTSAMIAKLFYDNWKVQKGIYVSQRNGRQFVRNTDAGFVVSREEQKFIVFIADYLNEDVLTTVKFVPSNIQKVVFTLDLIGEIQFEDGVIYYSYEKLLKEGLKIYGK